MTNHNTCKSRFDMMLFIDRNFYAIAQLVIEMLLWSLMSARDSSGWYGSLAGERARAAGSGGVGGAARAAVRAVAGARRALGLRGQVRLRRAVAQLSVARAPWK